MSKKGTIQKKWSIIGAGMAKRSKSSRTKIE